MWQSDYGRSFTKRWRNDLPGESYSALYIARLYHINAIWMQCGPIPSVICCLEIQWPYWMPDHLCSEGPCPTLLSSLLSSSVLVFLLSSSFLGKGGGRHELWILILGHPLSCLPHLKSEGRAHKKLALGNLSSLVFSLRYFNIMILQISKYVQHFSLFTQYHHTNHVIDRWPTIWLFACFGYYLTWTAERTWHCPL